MDLPAEVELKPFVDLIAKRLNLNIIYDSEQLVGKRVTIRSPNPMTEEVLLPVLQSALRTKQLALVEAGAPGGGRSCRSR